MVQTRPRSTLPAGNGSTKKKEQTPNSIRTLAKVPFVNLKQTGIIRSCGLAVEAIV